MSTDTYESLCQRGNIFYYFPLRSLLSGAPCSLFNEHVESLMNNLQILGAGVNMEALLGIH